MEEEGVFRQKDIFNLDKKTNCFNDFSLLSQMISADARAVRPYRRVDGWYRGYMSCVFIHLV